MACNLNYPRGILEHITGDLHANSVLGTADIVIYGSSLEEQSCPEILKRAMCFVKPIIAPDIPIVKKFADDRVNGYIFPKDNSSVLTQNLLEVISKGKISLLSRNIASIGSNTAKNLYVLEAIEVYASVLLNILRPALEVASYNAVSEISPSLKEQWQWHLFEAVSYVTYQNRTRRSNAFLHKYEEEWYHSQKNRSTITVAANDSFLYSFWEEEKYIQLAMTRRREEEELMDKTEHSHGTWEEVYRNAKRALKSKRELPVRDEEELERAGQPLCIYEPYFGDGTWPFLHHRSLYRGIGLSTKDQRPETDDIDAPSRLPLLNNPYYHDVLGEYEAFFAIANRIDCIHKNAWIRFQSWRATARKNC